MENVAQENEKAISGAIKIDEKEIRTHPDDWFDSRSRVRWMLFWMRKPTRSARLRGISAARIGRIRRPEAANANSWRKRAKQNFASPIYLKRKSVIRRSKAVLKCIWRTRPFSRKSVRFPRIHFHIRNNQFFFPNALDFFDRFWYNIFKSIEK